MSNELKDKVVVITGGTSGIGEATAKMFLKEGAKVVIVGSSKEKGARACDEIKKMGYEIKFIQADISKPGDVKALMDEVVITYKKIDYAVNNAAVDHEPVRAHEIPEEDWDRVIAVNLKGTWLCMKYELAQMLKQGCGSIVNVSSQGGLVAAPLIAAYASSKGGILQLTRTAALEYAADNIRINAVCPGTTRTPFLENMLKKHPEMETRMAGSIPLKRVATSDEIANAIVWMCSDKSSYLTGVCLPVDGGVTAG